MFLHPLPCSTLPCLSLCFAACRLTLPWFVLQYFLLCPSFHCPALPCVAVTCLRCSALLKRCPAMLHLALHYLVPPCLALSYPSLPLCCTTLPWAALVWVAMLLTLSHYPLPYLASHFCNLYALPCHAPLCLGMPILACPFLCFPPCPHLLALPSLLTPPCAAQPA